jgi:hypothetical protein
MITKNIMIAENDSRRSSWPSSVDGLRRTPSMVEGS